VDRHDGDLAFDPDPLLEQPLPERIGAAPAVQEVIAILSRAAR